MHDFKNFPELTNTQMQLYYFDSPHKQITEDFEAVVTKVHDGDTIKVKWKERDFEFPVRFSNIACAELNEGGEPARDWMRQRLEGKIVRIEIDEHNRVGRYGRLLGKVYNSGFDVGEEAILRGHATAWEARNEGKF